MRRGPLQSGEKVQFTDRKSNKITDQLVAGGVTQTSHGIILHDDVIGRNEGSVVTTVTAKREDQFNREHPERDTAKPWKAARAIGGWQFAVMRPRMADYVLSMPRGAQIMYPKDIAQVIELGDIRSGARVLESGAGSGAMSLHLLDAVGEGGCLTTIEMRPDFARIAEANATLYYGRRPDWWNLLVGDFDSVASTLPEQGFDRIMLDMLDPWNRLEQAYRVIAPGGVLVAYVTTTTQMSRMAEALRESEHWTAPQIQETMERNWKAQGLAVRPDHQMIGHTGFLIVSRAMAPGYDALRKRDRATKDTTTDIDSLSVEEREASLEELELRDISDRKLRKVLRDLDEQRSHLDSLKKVAKRAKEYKHVLIIMRHAKTEAFNAKGDFERVLTDKGLKQAKRVAKGLRDMGLVPDQIDCSSATRAMQTCERMLKVFGDAPKVDYYQDLYAKGMQAVFDMLAACKDKRHALLVLGHEPTVSLASQWLAGEQSDPGQLDLLNLGMSTAGVAIFGSNAPFRKWGTHEANLIAVLTPKEFEK